MSFKVLSKTHSRDRDFPARSFEIALRLSLLNGTFYNNLSYEFHEAWQGGDYVYLIDRKPNVPSGMNELQTQMHRHAATLFGDFPQIETQNEAARAILNDWADESELEERMRHAAFLGSVGSVAMHVRTLAQSNGRARVFLDVASTEYLTPEFDPNQPDVLIKVTQRYKIRGRDVADLGYNVSDDQLNDWFWFLRIWDGAAENWFVPWSVTEEREAISSGKRFTPTRDDDKSITHALGFCPWIWTRTPGGSSDAPDGPCTFEAGIEHAIQLDYQDSQIVAGIKYAMAPTMVLKVPATTGPQTGGGGYVKSPETILTIDAEGDAKYLEMDGAGFEQARAKSKELRSNLIEYVNGDRVDPKEITQGHQGSKTMAMINAPMLNHVKVLRKVYGASLKRILYMFLRIAATRPVYVNDERVSVPAGKLRDLNLRWDDFYELTSTEKFQDAQAIDVSIKNGTLSRETAINDMAKTYCIQDVPAERARIAADQQAEVAMAAAMAKAQAQVQVRTSEV